MDPEHARDPWVAGESLPGVAFAYNAEVEIVDGEYAGESGWLIALELGPDPVYTVELRSGGDVDVPQSSLRSTA